MRFHNIFHIAQAQACTFNVMYVASRNAMKFIEYELLMLFCNTRPVVFDAKDQPGSRLSML